MVLGLLLNNILQLTGVLLDKSLKTDCVHDCSLLLEHFDIRYSDLRHLAWRPDSGTQIRSLFRGLVMTLLLDELDDTLERILHGEHAALQMCNVVSGGCWKLLLDHFKELLIFFLDPTRWYSSRPVGPLESWPCPVAACGAMSSRLDALVVGMRTPVTSQRSTLRFT